MYFKVEFAVNGEHMGMVIGTNGNNIKRAQAIPGVHLIEVTRENKVIIYADEREQADAARELLEIIHSRVPVDSSEIGYIIGKGGEQIRDLQVLTRTCVSPCVSGALLTRAASRCIGSARVHRDPHERKCAGQFRVSNGCGSQHELGQCRRTPRSRGKGVCHAAIHHR